MSGVARPVGQWGFPPWLLGRLTTHLWRLEDEEGRQQGITMEMRRDDIQDPWPRVFIKMEPGRMRVFTQEGKDKPTVKVADWKDDRWQ